MMYSDLTSLTVQLPEDIAKWKWHGDFERAKRVIRLRLETDLPTMLRKRLELELEILERMPAQYPYRYEEALALLKENIADFQEEEFVRLQDENAVEWIFVNGEMHFKDNFLANLFKTRKSLEKRALDPAWASSKAQNFSLLDDVIARMREKGSLAYHMRIRSSVRIKPEAERPGERVRVHIPVPVEYAQVKHFRLLKASESLVELAPADYPQRTACFEDRLSAGEEFFVEYEFDNCMRYEKPDPDRVLDAQPTFYTEEQLPHVRFTPYMRALTAEVVGSEKNPLRKARSIYDYITTHVMYSYVRSYFTITDLPDYMATGFKGDCGIQALLFITMCRCAGIPARWQAGLYCTPLTVGHHDWAQFYVAPYGWLFADCSFGGSAWREKAMERWDFYFGNLDPFRIPAASEFQHEFTPPKAFTRSDPYDNQAGEVEYEDRGLLSDEFESVHERVEIRELE